MTETKDSEVIKEEQHLLSPKTALAADKVKKLQASWVECLRISVTSRTEDGKAFVHG